MAIDFMTADGLRSVRHWGYRLQGAGKGRKSHKLPIGELKIAPHDLIVMDFSKDGSDKGAFTAVQIDGLKQRKKANSVVVSYISIGEGESYRFYWNRAWDTEAPPWHVAENCAWPRNHMVRFWHDGWKDIIFRGQKSYLGHKIGRAHV